MWIRTSCGSRKLLLQTTTTVGSFFCWKKCFFRGLNWPFTTPPWVTFLFQENYKAALRDDVQHTCLSFRPAIRAGYFFWGRWHWGGLPPGTNGSMGNCCYNPTYRSYFTPPRTQMTLVLIGKGFVLGGWPSKIEVIGALGSYNWFSGAHSQPFHTFDDLWGEIPHGGRQKS